MPKRLKIILIRKIASIYRLNNPLLNTPINNNNFILYQNGGCQNLSEKRQIT